VDHEVHELGRSEERRLQNADSDDGDARRAGADRRDEVEANQIGQDSRLGYLPPTEGAEAVIRRVLTKQL
jgi:hypothetical protein